MLPNRLAFAFLILLTCRCVVPATTHAQSTPNSLPITNRDVVELVSDGFSSDVIKAKIASSSCQFDTSVEALKTLKKANVPQDVILAMLQAHSPANGVASSSKLKTIECAGGDTQAILWVAPGKMEEVTRLHCHEQVTVLSEKPPWVLARTESGLTGYLSAAYVNGQNTVTDPSRGLASSETNGAQKQRQEPERTVPTVPVPRFAAERGSIEQLQSGSGKYHQWRI